MWLVAHPDGREKLGAPRQVTPLQAQEGGWDDTVTLASHSEEIARAIPGAQLVILPGVHMLNVELPNDFIELLGTFLAD